MFEWLVFAVVLVAMMGGLSSWIASQKGRSPAEGLVLGLAFGPLGVLVEVLLPTIAATTRAESRALTSEPDDLPILAPVAEIKSDRKKEVPKAIDRIDL